MLSTPSTISRKVRARKDASTPPVRSCDIGASQETVGIDVDSDPYGPGRFDPGAPGAEEALEIDRSFRADQKPFPAPAADQAQGRVGGTEQSDAFGVRRCARHGLDEGVQEPGIGAGHDDRGEAGEGRKAGGFPSFQFGGDEGVAVARRRWRP